MCYLPVGSEQAAKFYAQCAIDAGVGFVNALPVFIASDPEWAKKFEDAGVPIVGDDIKSQVGATITHRVMAKLFEDRGVALDRTYQLNVGGNMDFKNMLERERLESKKVSKTQAVTSNLTGELADKIDSRNVHIGPSDYVAWLDDRKWAYVRLEGRAFGDVPLNLEYKLEVWDSPNSAGIIIDAVRAAKIALDRGVGGPIIAGLDLPDEVPAGADGRRPRPRRAREVHRGRVTAGRPRTPTRTHQHHRPRRSTSRTSRGRVSGTSSEVSAAATRTARRRLGVAPPRRGSRTERAVGEAAVEQQREGPGERLGVAGAGLPGEVAPPTRGRRPCARTVRWCTALPGADSAAALMKAHPR